MEQSVNSTDKLTSYEDKWVNGINCSCTDLKNLISKDREIKRKVKDCIRGVDFYSSYDLAIAQAILLSNRAKENNCVRITTNIVNTLCNNSHTLLGEDDCLRLTYFLNACYSLRALNIMQFDENTKTILTYIEQWRTFRIPRFDYPKDNINFVRDLGGKSEENITGLDKKKLLLIYSEACFKRGILPLFGRKNTQLLRVGGYIQNDMSYEDTKYLVDLTEDMIINLPTFTSGTLLYKSTVNLLDVNDKIMGFNLNNFIEEFEINPKYLEVRKKMFKDVVNEVDALTFLYISEASPAIIAENISPNKLKVLEEQSKRNELLGRYYSDILKAIEFLEQHPEIRVAPSNIYSLPKEIAGKVYREQLSLIRDLASEIKIGGRVFQAVLNIANIIRECKLMKEEESLHILSELLGILNLDEKKAVEALDTLLREYLNHTEDKGTDTDIDDSKYIESCFKSNSRLGRAEKQRIIRIYSDTCLALGIIPQIKGEHSCTLCLERYYTSISDLEIDWSDFIVKVFRLCELRKLISHDNGNELILYEKYFINSGVNERVLSEDEESLIRDLNRMPILWLSKTLNKEALCRIRSVDESIYNMIKVGRDFLETNDMRISPRELFDVEDEREAFAFYYHYFLFNCEVMSGYEVMKNMTRRRASNFGQCFIDFDLDLKEEIIIKLFKLLAGDCSSRSEVMQLDRIFREYLR